LFALGILNHFSTLFLSRRSPFPEVCIFYLSATFGSVSEGQQPGSQMQRRRQALLLAVAL